MSLLNKIWGGTRAFLANLRYSSSACENVASKYDYMTLNTERLEKMSIKRQLTTVHTLFSPASTIPIYLKYPLELGTNQGMHFMIREISQDFLTQWSSGRDDVKLGSTNSHGSVYDYTLLCKYLR